MDTEPAVLIQTLTAEVGVAGPDGKKRRRRRLITVTGDPGLLVWSVGGHPVNAQQPSIGLIHRSQSKVPYGSMARAQGPSAVFRQADSLIGLTGSFHSSLFNFANLKILPQMESFSSHSKPLKSRYLN